MNWANVKSLAIPVGGTARDVKRVSIGGVTVWEKNTTPTARDYVQAGLVAMWDGIENAGYGVHDAAARKWVDLVGGNDFSTFATNTAFGDDCLKLSAKRFAASGANSYSTNDIQTIEICLNIQSWNSLIVAAFADTNGSAPITRWLGFRNNGTFNFSNGGICAAGAMAGRATYSGTFSPSTLLYKNGVEQASAGSGMTWGSVSIGDSSAFFPWASAYNSVDIHSVRLYSRALTAVEIAANYAIDKARFGLP